MQWEVHTGDHIVEKSLLPKDKITGAQGSVLFLEEGALVPPITDFCEESISVGSQGKKDVLRCGAVRCNAAWCCMIDGADDAVLV